MIKLSFLKSLFSITIVILLAGCVTTIEPEFDYKSGLIFIDGFALSEPGQSFVTVKESIEVNNGGAFTPVQNVKVSFENISNGSQVILSEKSEGYYVPDSSFATNPGETWRLNIELQDGRSILSTPETVLEEVAIKELTTDFKIELLFERGLNDFVPGHEIKISFDDVAESSNYYLWKYKTWERIINCRTCVTGLLRNDTCRTIFPPPWQPQYYDYLCIGDCWRIDFGTRFAIFSDQFADGNSITSKPIIDIPFARKQDILVEVQQIMINESNYKYYKVINDLVEESGGLNAPTPTALLGNLTLTNNQDQIVLGNFIAASVDSRRIFIDRDDLPTSPFDPEPTIVLENCPTCPTNYPCIEGENRTKIKPDQWE